MFGLEGNKKEPTSNEAGERLSFVDNLRIFGTISTERCDRREYTTFQESCLSAMYLRYDNEV